MKRRAISAAVGLTIASAAGAQSSRPAAAWLGWSSVLVGIAPDSLGTHLWLTTATRESRHGYFFGTFDPVRLDAWIAHARDFSTRPLQAADTGNTRGSDVLPSLDGGGMYLARRRVNGAWSDERFFIVESLRDSQPVRIASDAESVGEILDSLQAVARRTPFSDSLAKRLFREIGGQPFDTPAYIDAGGAFPSFPSGERMRNPNGLVVVSFVVDEYGRVDANTIQRFFATSDAFAESVRDALPRMKFRPVIRLGGEVRTRVLMPFQFSIVR